MALLCFFLFYAYNCLCVFINDFTFALDTTKRMSILLCPPIAFTATVMMKMMMMVVMMVIMMNVWAPIFHYSFATRQ